jgi:hypothetical protein
MPLYNPGVVPTQTCEHANEYFHRIPKENNAGITIPANGTVEAANQIVNDLIPTFIHFQLTSDQIVVHTPLQGTLEEYEGISDWSEYTLSLRERSCTYVVDPQKTNHWNYEYTFQIEFADPASISLSGESIVFLGGYTGAAEGWEQHGLPTYMSGYTCIPPIIAHSAIETNTFSMDCQHNHPLGTPPVYGPYGQFCPTECDDSELADLPGVACSNCRSTTSLQKRNKHEFARNVKESCHINAYGADMRYCIMPDDCAHMSSADLSNLILSLESGIALYLEFIYQTHPSHDESWIRFDIMHVYINTYAADRMIWTFRSMLAREDVWGITLFEEAVEFVRFPSTTGLWGIAFKMVPETPSTNFTTSYTDQACTLGPTTFNWPETCDPSRTCANYSVEFPVYDVNSTGVNAGSACDTSFADPPRACPSWCNITWPSSMPHIETTKDADYTSTLSIAVFSTIGVLSIAAIAGVAVKIHMTK